ncbi:zinc finger protein nutcracker, partial [Phtheirospermum japonicum]
DPTAEVIALSPTTLIAKNRFVCEICNKGFQRDQNLQLHRRGHNLPWKLRQRTTTEVKKRVYICPEPTCVHHNPARALGDLTGIKKHYSRKHGEKKWKCDKCLKKYAVQSDWKAHQKTCGTREYKCDCETIFSRRDSFITHRAFCDALAQENSKVKVNQAQMPDHMPITTNTNTSTGLSEFTNPLKSLVPIPLIKPMNMAGMFSSTSSGTLFGNSPRSIPSSSSGLQKAAQMGATASNSMNSPMMQKTFVSSMAGPDQVYGPGPISNVHTFDNFQSPNDESPLFNGGSAVSDMMMMYGGMLIGNQNPVVGFLESAVEVQEESDQNSGIVHGSNNIMRRSPTRLGGVAMTTVDFLGVGGSGPQNLHDQGMDLEVMNQRRMQVLMNNNDPFHLQISQGDSDVEKPLYNTF